LDIYTLSLHDALPIYFFKSMDYYRKLMLFGDVPWLSSDLNIDSEELYKPRDKRTVVADSLMKTIDLAIAGLEGVTGGPDGRINQDRKSTRLNSSHVKI